MERVVSRPLCLCPKGNQLILYKGTMKKYDSRGRKAIRIILLALVGAVIVPTAMGGGYKRFIIYDKKEYAPEQLEEAMATPAIVRGPMQLKDGTFWVPRSPDGTLLCARQHQRLPGRLCR